MTCQEACQEAAVSLLGGTEPPVTVSEHLAWCAPCHREYAELAELVPLLDTARELPPQPVSPPSPLLLDRLLAEVGHRRRHRRLAVGLSLAAAAAVAVLVPLSRLADSPDHDTPVASASTGAASWPPDVVAAGSATGVNARALVTVRVDGSGSEVTVWVDGVPAGTPCRVIVRDANGSAVDAGVWTTNRESSTYVEDVTAPATGVREVQLLDDRTGHPMITVPVRRL